MSVTLEVPVPVAEMPGPARSQKLSFYRAELDSLRFLAFLGVFVFHALPKEVDAYRAAGSLARWIAGAIASGAFGVDLFFGLSAYLITTLLLREKESRGVLDVKAFYLRRILRIWPLYFAFVIFALLLTWIGFRSQNLTTPYVAGYALLAGNWMYVLYGLPQSVTIPLWSVSVEEQFYLMWPAVVRKISRRTMAYIAVSLLLLSNGVRILLGLWMNPSTPEYVMEYNTLVRMDPIAMGILLALWLGETRPRLSVSKRVSLFLLGAMTWIFVGQYAPIGVDGPVRVLYNIIGRPAIALASMAILTAVIGSQGVLHNRWLVYLGKISYGLYVIHEFALLVAVKAVGGHAGAYADAVITVCGLMIAVVLAAVSYRWLESPFLSLKSRFTYIASRSV
jgi:peptidoglycan/LPS O-acetylase OafA/YrhL